MHKIITALTVTVFCGCTTVLTEQTKTDTPPKKPPEELAHQFYEMFRRDGKTEDLVIANTLAQMAYQRAPDDVNLQEILYKTQYVRTALTPHSDLSKLNTLYQSLNPILASHLAPPSKISYSKAVQDEKPAQDIIQLIQQAIFDQPYFSDSWYRLAQLYVDQDQAWQALYPSLKAVQLDPEIADYQFQAGSIIESLASSRDCWVEHKSYLPKALPYFVKAASLAEHEVFFDNLALLYLRLGLAPIAYQQAHKAWDLKPNGWNGTHLAQAAFLMNKSEEAKKIATLVASQHKQIEGYFLLAVLAIEDQNWRLANLLLGTFLEHLKKLDPGTETTEVYIPYVISWLDALDSQTQSEAVLPQVSAPSPWTQSLVEAVEKNVKHHTQSHLAEQANNSCQHTEALFIDAMIAWRRGDNVQAQQWLTEIAQQGTPLYDETLLAKAMLRSGLFPAARQ